MLVEVISATFRGALSLIPPHGVPRHPRPMSTLKILGVEHAARRGRLALRSEGQRKREIRASASRSWAAE